MNCKNKKTPEIDEKTENQELKLEDLCQVAGGAEDQNESPENKSEKTPEIDEKTENQELKLEDLCQVAGGAEDQNESPENKSDLDKALESLDGTGSYGTKGKR